MMKTFALILLAVMAFALVGCAPGPNSLTNTNNEKGFVPGFWYGLWNGMIVPVTFIISLFNNRIQMYEVHNNGGWYNFGFILGISIVFSGTAGGSARRWRKA